MWSASPMRWRRIRFMMAELEAELMRRIHGSERPRAVISDMLKRGVIENAHEAWRVLHIWSLQGWYEYITEPGCLFAGVIDEGWLTAAAPCGASERPPRGERWTPPEERVPPWLSLWMDSFAGLRCARVPWSLSERPSGTVKRSASQETQSPFSLYREPVRLTLDAFARATVAVAASHGEIADVRRDAAIGFVTASRALRYSSREGGP